jgi:gamma-glutamylcyclotransferase (GGCT)/AIG2-like uncharacterized protein YtfP
MTYMFAFGTLRRAAWRLALLGHDARAEPAILVGWERIVLRVGYLSVRPRGGGVVRGFLLALDEVDWQIVDAWEAVPFYHTAEVTVETAHGPVAALVYTRDEPDAQPFTDDERDALLDDTTVEEAVAAFGEEAARLRVQAAPITRPSP